MEQQVRLDQRNARHVQMATLRPRREARNVFSAVTTQSHSQEKMVAPLVDVGLLLPLVWCMT